MAVRRGYDMQWNGERVRALRKRFDETQEEFARRIPGLSVDTIRNWEQDRFATGIPPLGIFALNKLQEELEQYEELKNQIASPPNGNGHKRKAVGVA